ncbi:MAG: 4-(cytidine 5'-diphospho)-2-C-methyl-D-erythritol kinase [Candidatus Marinimicrobia bacterium]|nr:4-(cytidine 5'-diphospho)-2-C-methyl-D-erythritol kinase [Candidatus Neomarinimicrobiota bacterium]
MCINSISIISPIKINLCLKILNKRRDGYHNLSTIFCELKMGDELSFTKSSTFKFTTDGIVVPNDDSNIVVKAYKLISSIKNKDMPEYNIHLNKKTPVGAGLGGGSSNAATVIKSLNTFWKLNLSTNEMISISIKLGSDVPFFIEGKVQHGEQKGEKLTPLNSTFLNNKKVLLICPNFSISTAWAYQNINKYLDVHKKKIKFAPLEPQVNWRLFDNDFEKVVRSTYPETGEIIQSLRKAGAIYSGLSGSGSTVFGIYNQNFDLTDIRNSFPKNYRTFVTDFVL